jgi:hypothetical protein
MRARTSFRCRTSSSSPAAASGGGKDTSGLWVSSSEEESATTSETQARRESIVVCAILLSVFCDKALGTATGDVGLTEGDVGGVQQSKVSPAGVSYMKLGR